MAKWEYWTGFLYADINEAGVSAFLRSSWPNWNAPRYAPQTLIPKLNEFGEAGYELVHMEPVQDVHGNGKVDFGGSIGHYSNIYFCVFKRQTSD
jgi:hypothetical protein